MNAAKNKKYNTAAQVIIGILIVLVISAAAGFTAYFTRGFNEGFKTFYVTNSLTGNIMSDFSDFVIKVGEPVRFDVKYTFGFLSAEKKGYTVRVVPNVAENNNFDFTVDGQKYGFKDESDLSAAFKIELFEDYFIFTAGSFDLSEILSAVYPGREIGLPENIAEIVKRGIFALEISSYDNSVRIRIGFLSYIPVESVTLDKGQIIL